jgi:ABC-2 type transport system ATP-binding protein
MEEFIARSSGHTVRVRTPQPEELTKALAAASAAAVGNEDGTLTVRGLSPDRIGDIAFEQGVRLHELTPTRASLEAAFMELTADSVEYQAGVPAQQAAGAEREQG